MIRNLLFDLGGVFVNLDEGATLQKLPELGFEGDLTQLYPIFFDYEMGQLSTPDFIKRIQPFFTNCREEDLINAWNAIILDLPEYRIEFLEDLVSDGKYRIFLVSNTNELHIEAVRQVTGEENYNRFRKCFDEFILSFEVGMRKPGVKIFNWILDTYDLLPGESLFIDDNAMNINSARQVGIHTWHLDPLQDDITDLINSGLI